MKLNIGVGKKPKEGFIGVDISRDTDADIIIDCEKPLPFTDESVDEVYSQHFLEHIHNPDEFLQELFRVCKPGAKCEFHLPNHSSDLSIVLSHYWQPSIWYAEALIKARGFKIDKIEYDFTKEIQDPKNPFHKYYLEDREACAKHLWNAVWQLRFYFHKP